MGALMSNHASIDDSSDYTSSSDDEEENSNQMSSEERQLTEEPLDEPDNCFDAATDAVGSSTHAYTPTIPIVVTLDQIFIIEGKLDLYEKVSLIYLLYDDPQLALNDLIRLLNTGSTDKLLGNWAILQNQQSQKWKEKFIESICIIQNYQVLKNFGFQRKDLTERFLPHHMFTTVEVNKARKALYMLCEDLTESETQKILDLVSHDFKEKNLEYRKFHWPYLELSLLHWEAVGYIKPDCLSNLYVILKQLEYFEMVDKLREIIPSPVVKPPVLKIEKLQKKSDKTVDANQKKKSPKIFDNILSPGSLMDLSNIGVSLDTMVTPTNNSKYEINPENPGVCLIINQENFYTEIDPQYKDLLPPGGYKLEERLGTKVDKIELKSTFKRFNFKTESIDNLTHSDILPKISQVIQSITDESSLFICIMSHGDEGVIYGVNSCRIRVEKIKNLMCSLNRKNLLGKPKVLILQSCQGTQCQKISSNDELFDDITTDSPSSSSDKEVVPPLADLFTFWATVRGYGAIRNKNKGTWFIQSLCEKMKELGDKDHFEDICTAVINDVSSKKWDRKEEGVAAMVPLKEGTFRKRFYLPPIRHDFI